MKCRPWKWYRTVQALDMLMERRSTPSNYNIMEPLYLTKKKKSLRTDWIIKSGGWKGLNIRYFLNRSKLLQFDERCKHHKQRPKILLHERLIFTSPEWYKTANCKSVTNRGTTRLMWEWGFEMRRNKEERERATKVSLVELQVTASVWQQLRKV